MFKVIHDLSNLNEEEKKLYLHDYSVFLGLNPEENRLDMIWMDADNSRALVAYCRRGTTDILRDVHGIDVTELTREDGKDYVSYKATGLNRKGRKEIAVGAYTTMGLAGDRLAAAVATAQTRALRRLTLQFVGGGLLDESEVNRQPVSILPSLVAAPAVQPEVATNQLVGKLSQPVAPPLSEAEPYHTFRVEEVNKILAETTPAEPEKPKRKPRKSKNSVDMGDAPAAPVESAVPVESANADIRESQPTATPVPEPVQVAQTTPAPLAVPPKTISVLTDVEQKQVKARLAPFWVEILPKGGMTADDGLSIWSKLIKYANTFYPEFPDYKKWTFDRWETFFEDLENTNVSLGAAGLVRKINIAIGATS